MAHPRKRAFANHGACVLSSEQHMGKWFAWLSLGLLPSFPVSAQIDLSTLDDGMAGSRAQVLVLGSVHLSGMPEGFRAESLEPVLDRLAAFKPDVIAIESMPGETCDLMRRHAAVYGEDAVDTYCPDPSAAKAATGLDVPAAIVEAERLLEGGFDSATPAQRRRLAAVFLAAGDNASALVQWLLLPEAERRAGDGLDETLVAAMRKRERYNNESYQIGSRLAVRLGLQRVVPSDDHTGDNLRISDVQAYGNAIQRAWDGASAEARTMREREMALGAKGDMLPLYRLVNSPDYLRVALAADFGAAMAEPSPERYGRQYVAGWEARNLRMAANVRAAFRERPGARVLFIVGASHKPWMDALLGQMLGVDIVDAERILE